MVRNKHIDNISMQNQKSRYEHNTRTAGKSHQVVLCLSNVHVTRPQRCFVYFYCSNI